MAETLLELLGLPDVPWVVFEHPPLVLAICQIKFPHNLSVADAAFVAPFQRAIQSRYPIMSPGNEVNLQVAISPVGAQIQHQSRGDRWQFADLEDTWKVVLTPDSLGVETRSYQDFGEFIRRLQELLDALVRHIQPTMVTRIGLRYINEIRPDDLTWTETLRSQLLGVLAVPELGEHAAQAVQELQLRYQDGQVIVMRHGLLPGGSTVQPQPGQTPPTKPFYLFDLDVYREFPGQAALAMNVESVCQCVETYNKAIYRLFRWAITEEYTSTLGAR